MPELLLGTAAALCVLVGVLGVVLIRRPAVELPGPVGGAGQPSAVTRLVDSLGAVLSPRVVPLAGERWVRRTDHRLDAAGRPERLTAAEFLGRQAAVATFGALLGAAFLLRSWRLPAVLVLLGSVLLLEVWLSGEIRRRQARIERDLPDLLEVLAIVVAAGLGFRTGVARVAAALGGPLEEEVLLTLRHLDIGMERRAAFGRLRERNRSESLGRFVTAVLQTEELGAPLAPALVSLSVDMRRTAAQTARKRAYRAEARITLVTTFLLLPGAVILIAAGVFTSAGGLGGLLSP